MLRKKPRNRHDNRSLSQPEATLSKIFLCYITTPDRQIRNRSQQTKDLPLLHYDSSVTRPVACYISAYCNSRDPLGSRTGRWFRAI